MWIPVLRMWSPFTAALLEKFCVEGSIFRFKFHDTCGKYFSQRTIDHFTFVIFFLLKSWCVKMIFLSCEPRVCLKVFEKGNFTLSLLLFIPVKVFFHLSEITIQNLAYTFRHSSSYPYNKTLASLTELRPLHSTWSHFTNILYHTLWMAQKYAEVI